LIVINGKIAGTWKRKSTKKGLVIETNLLAPVSRVNEKKIAAKAREVVDFYALMRASSA
jgi:hypothetical protein